MSVQLLKYIDCACVYENNVELCTSYINIIIICTAIPKFIQYYNSICIIIIQ